MDLPLTPTEIIALKTATLDLVKAVGGVERAALLRGVSKATVHRWYALPEADPDQTRLVTIDAASIFILERDMAEMGSARRPVTECLARMNGGELADITGAKSRHSVAVAASKVMGLTGQLAATILEVMEDGKVTPSEAQIADRIAGEADSAIGDLRSAFAAIRGREDMD